MKRFSQGARSRSKGAAPARTRPVFVSITSPSMPEEEIVTSASTAGRGMKRRERFIRCPLPLDWMQCASLEKGSVLQVALVLRYLQGLENERTIRLKASTLRDFGVDRHASGRALKRLEELGLVKVARRRGAAPLVTILDLKVAP